MVPEQIADIFHDVEKKVHEYFNHLHFDPCSGEITIDGERYLLLRSSSMSYEFIDFIKERYPDHTEQEAISIGHNFMHDNAKVIGKKDALAFHPKLDLMDPIDKLSAGPVHFAFTGWANVEIFPESNPTPDEDYFLKFQHHNSFEAQSWIKAGIKSDIPVCTMNCGYSAGWCEESFGLSLTTVELTCEAQGADACTFIMAPTDQIQNYVQKATTYKEAKQVEIPVFFKRKHIQEQLEASLAQKELLIKEIHHRVKNNLQIIVSLLRLQMEKIDDPQYITQFETSINRVNTMASVHELMYRGEDFEKLDMESYFKNLMSSLVQMYGVGQVVELDLKFDIDNIDLNLEQSIPLGLLMNEITCNSFQHAFDDGGKLSIALTQKDGKYILTIGDNGPGLKNEKSNGLGRTLIELLCDQIDADLFVDNSSEGLIYKIEFSVV
jgi:two-component sensor histidine kinase/predicted hydrocarbon binding protein